MNIRIADHPPIGAPVEDGHDPRWSRPQVVVLLERRMPAPWTLRHLVWLARRLDARLLVAAVVTQSRRADDLDQANLEIARDGVEKVTTLLVEQGVRATGQVKSAPYGEQAQAACDLVESLSADLVIVLARRGSWLGVFPGSVLAHRLMRRSRRPVLVIPDRVYQRTWRDVLLGLVGMQGTPAEIDAPQE